MTSSSPENPAIWDKQKIQALLSRSDRAVMRAVVAIYRRQTSEEQVGMVTTESNGRGFGLYDAELLSNVAKTLLDGRPITEKQLAISRNKMKKYWRQLLEIANGCHLHSS